MNVEELDGLIISQIKMTSFNQWEADQTIQAFKDRDPDGDTWPRRAEAIARGPLTIKQKMLCINRMRELRLFRRYPEFSVQGFVVDNDLGEYLIIESEAVLAGTGVFASINVQGVRKKIPEGVKGLLFRIKEKGVGIASAMKDHVRSLCDVNGKYHDEWKSRENNIDPANTIESLVLTLYSRPRKGAVGMLSLVTTLDPDHVVEAQLDNSLNIHVDPREKNR